MAKLKKKNPNWSFININLITSYMTKTRFWKIIANRKMSFMKDRSRLTSSDLQNLVYHLDPHMDLLLYRIKHFYCCECYTLSPAAKTSGNTYNSCWSSYLRPRTWRRTERRLTEPELPGSNRELLPRLET